MSNSYMEKIRERIMQAPDGSVFVNSDFADITDTNTIKQIISRLIKEGTLRRIIRGVFEKPKYSKLLQEYVAADPNEIANALARCYHWTISKSVYRYLHATGHPLGNRCTGCMDTSRYGRYHTLYCGAVSPVIQAENCISSDRSSRADLLGKGHHPTP